MDDPGPFRVRVYSKAFAFLFPLADASVSVSLRHLAIPTGSITIPLTHQRADAMFTPGTRVVIDYLTGTNRGDDASWTHAMSGWLTSAQVPQDTKPTVGKTVTFGVIDDYWVIAWMLLWPKPSNDIAHQTTATDVRTGAAESVIKAYVNANKGRLSIPLTTATDHATGNTVSGSYRFDNAMDVLPGLAQVGGIGISVKQVGSGLVLDTYAPTDRTARVLSEAAGTITSWSLASTAPSVTRAIIASSGVGTSRAFTEQFDGTGLEALYGIAIETFVDARDTADATTLTQRGQAAIAAGAPQAGYSITVAETPVVRAMVNLFVGDLVAVQITPTLALEDICSQMTITWSPDAGKVVTPQIGPADATAQPDALFAQAIAAVGRGVRYLRSSL